MKVSEIMHANPVCVSMNESIVNIAKQMVKGDFGSVIVKDGDNKALGILTDRDIVTRAIAQGKDIDSLQAKDIMSKTVYSCDLNDTLEKATSIMKSEQIRRLVVLDDTNKTVGILSLGDLAISEKNKESGLVFETLEKISEPN